MKRAEKRGINAKKGTVRESAYEIIEFKYLSFCI